MVVGEYQPFRGDQCRSKLIKNSVSVLVLERSVPRFSEFLSLVCFLTPAQAQVDGFSSPPSADGTTPFRSKRVLRVLGTENSHSER